MRPHYEVVDIGSLELERAFRPNTVNVISLYIYPEYQGLGFGTAMMRAACKEADEQGIEIWLVPTSIDGREEDLKRFYSRLGFEAWQGSGYWIRRPKTPT